MNPARRLFPICVSPLSFTHLRFGIVNPYGTSCVSTSRSPRPFSHRQFDPCNPHVESACLLSEVLGRCHIGILDFTTLTQFVWVHFRMSRTIRSLAIHSFLLHLIARPCSAECLYGCLGSSPGVSPSPPRCTLSPILACVPFLLKLLLKKR